MTMTGKSQVAVAIVGGGPTGLLTALLLASRGVEAVVLEQRSAPPNESRAIGITPPSLDILDSVGLADPLVNRGVMVRRAVVHSAVGRVGELVFDGVHQRFGGIMACPQAVSWAVLDAAADAHPLIDLRRNTRVVHAFRGADIPPLAKAVTGGRASHDSRRFEGERCFTVRTDAGDQLHSQLLVIADGARGVTAPQLGFKRVGGSYRDRFVMADMVDRSDLGTEAHLWFTREGAVESFPLPGHLRRWIVQVPDGLEFDAASESLEALVARRAGYALDRADRRWQSNFHPSWSRLDRLAQRGVFVVGDAAHTMSPIGGQGMNTGFADAELAALLIARVVAGADGAAAAERLYHRARSRAAAGATRRAWAGMSVGTMRGRTTDALRGWLVGVALRSRFRGALARHFAMLTIPYARAAMVYSSK